MTLRHGLLVGWVLVGCAGKEPPAEEETDTTTEPDTDVVDSDEPEPEPEPPTIAAAFTPATVAAGEAAELAVTIENFTIVDPTASPTPKPAEGEGHFHVYLDDALVVAAWNPTLTIQTGPDDAPGDYVFDVRLVDSAHFEIEPGVSVEVTLTIE